MASRNGIATIAPRAPRRNVRRGRCFFVMIIGYSFGGSLGDRRIGAGALVSVNFVRIWNGALCTIPSTIDCMA